MDSLIYIFLVYCFLGSVIMCFCLFVIKENRFLLQELERLQIKEYSHCEQIYNLENELKTEKLKINKLKEHNNCKYKETYEKGCQKLDVSTYPCCDCYDFSKWKIKD